MRFIFLHQQGLPQDGVWINVDHITSFYDAKLKSDERIIATYYGGEYHVDETIAQIEDKLIEAEQLSFSDVVTTKRESK